MASTSCSRRSRGHGGKQILDAPIAVATADTGASWIVSPAQKAGRVDVARVAADDDVAGSLVGPADQVLLALWHRLPLERVDVELTGQRAVVAAFVAGPVSP